MKILLVHPPEYHLNTGHTIFRPITLMYLGSYLMKKGFSVQILDLAFMEDPFPYYMRFLRDNQADLIGFTGGSAHRFFVRDLITVSKDMLPKATVVVGGRHFGNTPEESLEHIPGIDVVVRGEGEITLHEIVLRLQGQEDLHDLAGISYRDRTGQIIHNQPRANAQDIEQFTIDPAIDNFLTLPHGRYDSFAQFSNYEEENFPTHIVTIGRGCPGKCIFCADHKRFIPRYRNIDNIFKEIRHKIQTTGSRYFMFWDPHIIKRKKFFVDFCEKLIEENLNIRWWAESRADIDLDLIDLAKKAGCISMDIGLESASQPIVDTLKKGIKVYQAQQVVDKCHALGIRTRVTTMVSLPGETYDDLLKTLHFLIKNKTKLSNISGSPTMILPGTELECMARAQGVIDKDFSWYDEITDPEHYHYQIGYPNVPLWLEHFSKQQISHIMSLIHCIQIGHEWHEFIKQKPFADDARVAIYSAGHTTETFLQKIKQIHPAPCAIRCIIDKYKTGSLDSIPVLSREKVEYATFDHILITTPTHYQEAAEFLARQGLKKGKDFSFVYFLDDMLERFPITQAKP